MKPCDACLEAKCKRCPRCNKCGTRITKKEANE